MKIITSIVAILLSIYGHAQNHPLFVSSGAKSLGLANTYVNQGDVWSNFNNQAGLSQVEDLTFGVFGENRFISNSLNTIGFAGALPTKSGVFGLGFKRFGYKDLFHQSNISLNYGRILTDNITIGAGLSYLSTFIGNNYGKSGNISANLGITSKLNDKLKLGAHVSNLNRAKLDDYNDERYPTIFTLGLQYNISDKVESFIELDKDIAFKQSVRGSINYKIDENFVLRIGAATNPTLFSFGLGYGKKAFKIDFGSSYHQVLGFTSNVTLLYSISK